MRFRSARSGQGRAFRTAKRTLDGEDRSGIVRGGGKGDWGSDSNGAKSHVKGRSSDRLASQDLSPSPTYFQPLRDGGYTFVDGGVWANNPVMIALVDALTCFAVPRERISILSIGCGDEPYFVGRSKVALGGLLAWRDIICAAMKLQSLNALGQAGLLIGADRVIRVDAPVRNGGIRLDDWTRASQELPEAASTALIEKGDTVAAMFLSELAVPYKPVVV